MSTIACIIPARDEASTVGGVVTAALAANIFESVIVVSDGSRDGTIAAARAAGARVVALNESGGKGSALMAGLAATTAEIVCFLDADMIGFGSEQIREIVAPVSSGLARMCVGVRDSAGSRLFRFRRLFLISGQRALRREVFAVVPEKWRRGYRVEKALNFACRVNGWPISVVALPGLGTRTKFAKTGFLLALWRHLAMIVDVALTTLALTRHRADFLNDKR